MAVLKYAQLLFADEDSDTSYQALDVDLRGVYSCTNISLQYVRFQRQPFHYNMSLSLQFPTFSIDKIDYNPKLGIQVNACSKVWWIWSFMCKMKLKPL